MLPAPKHLRETHLIGPRCREWVLNREHVPQLRTARFVWVGHSELRPPYRMVRLCSSWSHVVACFGGHGRTLIDGRWQEWGVGQVLFAPAKALHAFEVVGRGPWRIAWVFFDDLVGPPVVSGDRTRLVEADATDFVSSLQMLTREASGEAQPTLLQSLVAAVETYVQRLIGPSSIDLRLWRLWEQVQGDLGAPWDNCTLARAAATSEEHLRRLCRRHYQRSPTAHLTHLRMQRACTLLRSGPAKIEDIGLASQKWTPGSGSSDVLSLVTVLKRHRGYLTQRAVAPRGVVEGFDVVEDGKLSITAGSRNDAIKLGISLAGAPE